MKVHNDLDMFGERRILIAKPDAYAATPGSGPAGKRCKHCVHCVQVGTRGGNVHRKCDLVVSTHGAATDIKVTTPACKRFEPPPQTRAEYYGIDSKKLTKTALASVASVRAKLNKAFEPYMDIDGNMEAALDKLLESLTEFEAAIQESSQYLADPFE